jgi:hypothetical protein
VNGCALAGSAQQQWRPVQHIMAGGAGCLAAAAGLAVRWEAMTGTLVLVQLCVLHAS